jgi:hypothetical protein
MLILFLGLARNCEETLPAFFDYLGRLRSKGAECVAFIGENGSRDQTRATIMRSGTSDVRLVDTACMNLEAARLAKMAVGRQCVLEAARAKEGADYVCVMDLDNVMHEPPETASLLQAIDCLEGRPDLFAIGASSYPVYYDLLSLRAEGHDYSALNEQIAKAKRNPLTYYRFHQRRIYANQRIVTHSQPALCTSSFNGCCLYKARYFFRGTYRSSDEARVCEHVTLNLSIARASGKGMMISPRLILRAPADHVPVGLARFWTDRFVDAIRAVKGTAGEIVRRARRRLTLRNALTNEM